MTKVRSFCLRAVTAALLAGSVMLPAKAAETNAEGASAIVRALTSFLPEKLVASDFVTATPEGDHYAVKLDFAKLVTAFKPVGTMIDARGVYDVKVYPPEGSDGLMAVKRDAAPLKVSGSATKGEEKGDFSYTIDNFAVDGQFDPAIYYFRNGTAKASGGAMTVNDGKQKIAATFGPMDQTMLGTRNADGSTDLTANATLADLKETIEGPGAPKVDLSIGSMKVDAGVKGLKMPELSALVGFFVTHAEKPTLTPEEKKSLAGLVKSAMPVLTGIDEVLTAEKVAVSGPGFGARIDAIDYRFGMDGFTDNAALRMGFGIRNPDISGVPQMLVFGDLVPKELSADFSIPGLNFASAANAFFEQANFDAKEPLTKEQSAAIGKMFLSTGRLDIDVSSFVARSALYDIAITGRFSTDVEAEPAKANASFDVTAKDLDKTIKGIQELGQRVPDLNSASFMLMMAKGMAKTDPDGTSRWKIEISDDGKVTVNGQAMPQ